MGTGGMNGSLKERFQGLIPDGESVIQGTVIAVNPLKIQAENDPKLLMPEPILIIPFHLQNYRTQIHIQWNGLYGAATIDSQTKIDGTHTHGAGGVHVEGDDSQNHPDIEGAHINHLDTFNIYNATMSVQNALMVGERVHLLSFNHGKKYYILDRVASDRKVN